MLEQISNSIMGLAFFSDSSGNGVTGLTVTVDAWRVVNNAGTPSATQVLTNQSATEIGGGVYARILSSASVTAEGEYVFVFKTASSSVRDKQLPALWTIGTAGIEHLDADIGDVQTAVDDVQTTVDNIETTLNNGVTVSVGDITAINFNGQGLVAYGDHGSETLDGSVFSLTIPRFATVIGMQAVGQSIYWTADGSTPSATHGFALNAGDPIQFFALDDYRTDQAYQFLRAASGANLQYRFYRPER